MLLAVIFRCENALDSQIGFELGISQNINAVFPRIRAILGVGNPSREDSLRRRSGAGKRAGRGTVFRGIPDRLKTRTPKTGVLFPFPLLQPISPEFRLPIGAIRAHFKSL